MAAKLGGRRFDRLVLACGAVGLAIGLGFIVVGLGVGPTTYSLLGAILVALVGLVVLPSPFLPRDFARASAMKVALFCVVAAVFVVALVPVSGWLAQYLSGAILHSIPTPSAAAPSLTR
jgi:CBS domain containing-hemolysin-like protein